MTIFFFGTGFLMINAIGNTQNVSSAMYAATFQAFGNGCVTALGLYLLGKDNES